MTGDDDLPAGGQEAAERYYQRANWIQAGLGTGGMLLVGAAAVSMTVGGLYGWLVGLLSVAGFAACIYMVWTSCWLRPFKYEGWTYYGYNRRHIREFTERGAQQIIDNAQEGDQ